MAPPSTPRKSRNKGKTLPPSSTAARNDAILVDSKTNIQSPSFPLASFFWPARKSSSQWIVLPLVLMIVGLFRWCAGLWGYSGFQTPPMHGDFEAQRHWMELTTHLPVSQWYFYDLEYWGLDYPPLTAYHSWLLGKIGSFINPTWFELDSSRGIEQQLLKVYMRATVIISEYLVYIPAAVILNRKLGKLRGVNKWESSIALVAVLMQPGTILIDHAHFQYNTVMLGFVLASISSILSERYLWSSVFFVCALCFKQMALYFAPAMFAFLLGVCVEPRIRMGRLIGIVITTLLSFALVFAPILLLSLYDHYRNINPPLSTTTREVNPLFSLLNPYINPNTLIYPLLLQLTQTIHRTFPFARGLFEDKVANLWCALHTIHKLHTYPTPLLQLISLSATLATILPSYITISLFPRRELLPWALASSAWAFFLCSFQVHEKSVLLPLLPMTILFGSDGGLGAEKRAWIGWANMLGAWTMFPLLKRDELRIPYFVLTGLWAYLLGLPPTNLDLYLGRQARKNGLSLFTKTLHLSFYAAMLAWHLLEASVAPPNGKPDLWVVINAVLGAAGFGICYLWCTWQLVLRSGVLDEWERYRSEEDGKSEGERARAMPLPWPLGRGSPGGKRGEGGKEKGKVKVDEKGGEGEKRKVGRGRKKGSSP